MQIHTTIFFILLTGIFCTLAYASDGVRIKELGRIGSEHDNSLVGYGIVTGLAGTGDTSRTAETFQSISNVLKNFGVTVPASQIRSRNTASVMIVGTLPPYAQKGDKIDVNISSIGDAKSLLGGTLLRAHLQGPDGVIYALAQGPLSIGGYHYDLNGNVIQKNHPTAGYISGGAIVERTADLQIVDNDGKLNYVLNDPDYTTANRITDAINQETKMTIAQGISASLVSLTIPEQYRANIVAFITQVENTWIVPDRHAKVVINERTGTVVSGGDVRISKVSVTHGDLKVFISTEYQVSQPTFVRQTGSKVQTAITPSTTIDVTEAEPISVSLQNDSSISDLVAALHKVHASSRDIITILQSIKRAGGLHAELIIQ